MEASIREDTIEEVGYSSSDSDSSSSSSDSDSDLDLDSAAPLRDDEIITIDPTVHYKTTTIVFLPSAEFIDYAIKKTMSSLNDNFHHLDANYCVYGPKNAATFIRDHGNDVRDRKLSFLNGLPNSVLLLPFHEDVLNTSYLGKSFADIIQAPALRFCTRLYFAQSLV